MCLKNNFDLSWSIVRIVTGKLILHINQLHKLYMYLYYMLFETIVVDTVHCPYLPLRYCKIQYQLFYLLTPVYWLWRILINKIEWNIRHLTWHSGILFYHLYIPVHLVLYNELKQINLRQECFWKKLFVGIFPMLLFWLVSDFQIILTSTTCLKYETSFKWHPGKHVYHLHSQVHPFFGQ